MNTVKSHQITEAAAWEKLHKHALFVTSQARSCLNCEHWGDDEDQCLKFKVKPPAKVIVFSCEAWDDRIPF